MHRMEREPEYQRLLRNDRSRLPLATQFVKQFCDSIDDTKEWKSLATSHSYVTRELSDTEETLPLVKFRSMYVQDVFEDILGLSNPLIVERFDWVKEHFDFIYDDGYHRIETLLPKNHAFDRAVIEHCRQNYPNGEHILDFGFNPDSEDRCVAMMSCLPHLVVHDAVMSYVRERLDLPVDADWDWFVTELWYHFLPHINVDLSETYGFIEAARDAFTEHIEPAPSVYEHMLQFLQQHEGLNDWIQRNGAIEAERRRKLASRWVHKNYPELITSDTITVLEDIQRSYLAREGEGDSSY